MQLLNMITENAYQGMFLIGEDNSNIIFRLRYQPTQQLWFYDIEYGEFKCLGNTLVISPNFLYKFTNLLPFGMSCISTDGFDPYYIDDFIKGRISIYLLTNTEKLEFNQIMEDVNAEIE